jgi:hypothetical protein
VVASNDSSDRVASPHPTSEHARFIPRLGHGQQALIPLLRKHGVSIVVAPLYYLEHNSELSLVPTSNAMAKVLDPCTQMRQKPWAERPNAFRSLSFGNDPDSYDPERARMSDAEFLDLATGPLDLQRGRGATLMLSTFHLAGGWGTRGRDIELALAGLAVEHFRQQRIDEPPQFAAVPIRREIYATAALRLEDLMSPRARQALADAYLALGADGIWVKIADFHQRTALDGIRAGSAFLGALREGDLPIVSCGSGQLHLAMLADEISASIGLAESELFTLPATWDPRKQDGTRRGRRRMAYNSTLHCAFRVGSKEAKGAFAAARCGCAEHPPSKAPTGLLVARHAAILRSEQAAEALSGDRHDRREWLTGSAVFASWKAADAGMPDKHTAVARYHAVFEGLDSGAQAAPGEQIEL